MRLSALRPVLLAAGTFIAGMAINAAAQQFAVMSQNPAIAVSQPPQSAVNATQPVTLPTTNPCAQSGIAVFSAPISQAAATTGVLIAGQAGKQIFVCGASWGMVQNDGTLQFVQASATASAVCPTPIVNLSGAYPSGNNNMGQGMTVSAGNKLCIITGGGKPDAEGEINYVVQ